MAAPGAPAAAARAEQSPNTERAEPYLRIRGLTKRFGAFTALADVDLDVWPGELVTFLGPSGCGKTTLLRAIAGLDPQTAGTIEQAGREISRLPASARDFGIVFQSYALFPNLTVRDNVAYGLFATRRSKREIETRVAELLELVGLADQADKYPAQLSGGQQQRVALARALALRPGLLLLDEPLSALDARVRVRLRAEIRDLQRRLGLTTILVTHDQEEALTISDRIVVMNRGRIEQVGTPEEVYARPATPFVADFVGKMNFLEGRLAAPDRVALAGAELRLAAPVALPPASRVLLCIRPEEVVLREAARSTDNRLLAEVAAMDFVGSHYATRLRILGTELALFAELSLNAVRDLGIRPGARLPVRLPAERLRLFPAGEPRR
ncbi:MAG: putative 2-aminoethylphosphonate ABC transporter ATP-binding protein [Geminicoccaceae bacterium]|nr:putative 2-aminoethylphosphonate ABC transporter ATP-binding protein [Geminicoccaceae bacterium]